MRWPASETNKLCYGLVCTGLGKEVVRRLRDKFDKCSRNLGLLFLAESCTLFRILTALLKRATQTDLGRRTCTTFEYFSEFLIHYMERLMQMFNRFINVVELETFAIHLELSLRHDVKKGKMHPSFILESFWCIDLISIGYI